MSANLEVKARGALTGVFLIAIKARLDELGQEVEPELYFLAWEGSACSPLLHVSPETAIGELIALENDQLRTLTTAELLSALPFGASSVAARIEGWANAAAFDWQTLPTVASATLTHALSTDMKAAMAVVGVDPSELLEFSEQERDALVHAVGHTDTVAQVMAALDVDNVPLQDDPTAHRARGPRSRRRL
jgi:hypothetical protein